VRPYYERKTMIHIAREVTNRDGQTVQMFVVYDLNGVFIVRKTPDGGTQSNLYTHEEAAAIYDLMSLAIPAYKSGVSTP
jgi:hypothetical protein